MGFGFVSIQNMDVSIKWDSYWGTLPEQIKEVQEKCCGNSYDPMKHSSIKQSLDGYGWLKQHTLNRKEYITGYKLYFYVGCIYIYIH